MARDRDSAQDREIAKMERLNKHHKNDRVAKCPTLKEQLEEEKKMKAMSPEQKRAAMDWHDWEYKLRTDLLFSKEYTIPQSHYQKIISKYKKEMEKFHKDGTAFRTIYLWMEERSDEMMGWNAQ